MGHTRRSGMRVITIIIPVALFSLLPAGVLRNLPLMGTVQELIDMLFTEVVKDAIAIYEKGRTKK